MRKKLIVANWKMHKLVGEAEKFCQEFLPLVAEETKVGMAICPPFTALYTMNKCLSATAVKLGAQNVFAAKKGAYTGEIAPAMLTELGCSYVLIGHSERRQIMGENDELINRKLGTALEAGLIPILCVGETLAERESGQAYKVVENQLQVAVQGLEFKPLQLVIAYEPVWAIGTGINASVDDAQAMASFIRDWLAQGFSEEMANTTPILYGGSVNEANLADFISAPDIDGALVGGASLAAEALASLIRIGDNVE